MYQGSKARQLYNLENKNSSESLVTENAQELGEKDTKTDSSNVLETSNNLKSDLSEVEKEKIMK